MKKSSLLLALAAGALLASCSSRSLSPEELSSLADASSATGGTSTDGSKGTDDSKGTSTDDSKVDSVDDSTDDSTGDSTEDSVNDSTEDSVNDSTDDSTGDSTDGSTDDSTAGSDEDTGRVIYFRDAPWWNSQGAHTVACIDDTDYAIMDYLRFVPQNSDEVGYNYWSIEVPDTASTITFYRGYEDPEVSVPWGNISGPKTPTLYLAQATGDLYDILNTEANWDQGATIEGVWGTYDPEDGASSDSGSGDSSTSETGLVITVNGEARTDASLDDPTGTDKYVINMTLEAEDVITISVDGVAMTFAGMDSVALDTPTTAYTITASGDYTFYVTASDEVWGIYHKPTQGAVEVNIYTHFSVPDSDLTLPVFVWVWDNDPSSGFASTWYAARHIDEPTWENEWGRHFMFDMENPVGKQLHLVFFSTEVLNNLDEAGMPKNWDLVVKKSEAATVMDWGTSVGCDIYETAK